MAYSLVTHTIAGDGGTTSSVTTSAIDTTGAKLLVVGIMRDFNTNPTVLSDSKSNTWTYIRGASLDGSIKVELYYCINPTVGSSHTFSNTGSFNFSSLAVSAFSGNAPYTILDVNSGSTNASTTIAPGSITPTQDNCLVITILGINSTGTPISINDSFTKTDELNFNSGVSYGGAMAYKIQTTASAANPTWTRTASGENASVMVAFKLSPEVALSWTSV